MRRLARRVSNTVVVAAARGVGVVVRDGEDAGEVCREVQSLNLVGGRVVLGHAPIGVVRVLALGIVAPELRVEDVQTFAAPGGREVPQRRAGSFFGLDGEGVGPPFQELRHF